MTEEQLTFFGQARARKEEKRVRFTLRRSFAASLETVFDAWLIPYKAGTWIFGPRTGNQEIVSLENEPRPGGSYSYEIVRDGETLRLTGSYREIRRPEKLICSFGPDPDTATLMTIYLELSLEDGKTRMKLTHEMDASLADQEQALRDEWSSRCKALAELVERSASQTKLFR